MAGVNFLPWRRRRRQRCVRIWAVSFVASAVVMGFSGFLWRASVAADLHRVTIWQHADTALLNALAVGEKSLQVRRQTWLKEQERRRRRQDTLAWQQTLLSLAINLPQNAWLTQLRWQQNQLTLSGLANTAGALSALEQQLRSLAGFQLQQTGAMERDAQGRWQFHYQLNKERTDASQR